MIGISPLNIIKKETPSKVFALREFLFNPNLNIDIQKKFSYNNRRMLSKRLKSDLRNEVRSMDEIIMVLIMIFLILVVLKD